MKQLGNGISSIKTNTRDYDEEEYKKEAKMIEEAQTSKVSELFSSSLFSQSDSTEENDEDKTKDDETEEENKVLVNYALLTQEELEVTFGEYKPCASLNPYMVKAWFNLTCNLIQW